MSAVAAPGPEVGEGGQWRRGRTGLWKLSFAGVRGETMNVKVSDFHSQMEQVCSEKVLWHSIVPAHLIVHSAYHHLEFSYLFPGL